MAFHTLGLLGFVLQVLSFPSASLALHARKPVLTKAARRHNAGALKPGQNQSHHLASRRQNAGALKPGQNQSHHLAEAARRHNNATALKPGQNQSHHLAEAARRNNAGAWKPGQNQSHHLAEAARRNNAGALKPAQNQSQHLAQSRSQEKPDQEQRCRSYAAMSTTSINLAYFDQTSNVGDIMSPDLVGNLSGGRSVLHCDSEDHDKYLVIGSIIQSHADKHSIVWGAGLIGSGYDLRAMGRMPKRIYAVRGPRTRSELLRNGALWVPTVYGDPAILYPSVYDPRGRVEKRYDVCVVPHYVDKNVLWVKDVVRPGYRHVQTYLKYVLLDVQASPRTFVDQLVSCNFVVSSSLHGLILSDAYGIPNKWIHLSDDIAGRTFKFKDYFEGVGRTDQGTVPEHVDPSMGIDSFLAMKPTDYGLDLEPVKRKLLEACPFCKIPYGREGPGSGYWSPFGPA